MIQGDSTLECKMEAIRSAGPFQFESYESDAVAFSALTFVCHLLVLNIWFHRDHRYHARCVTEMRLSLPDGCRAMQPRLSYKNQSYTNKIQLCEF